MSDNETRRAQRAAAGLAKAIRHDFVRPDTQIVGPHGKTIILGRRDDLEHVPAFQKSNPEKRRSSIQQQRVMTPAAVAAQARRGGGLGSGLGNKLMKGPMAALGRLPLMNLLVTAALVHRVWCFVTRRFFGEGGSGGGGGGRRGDGRQLAKYGGQEDAYDDEDEDEFDMDERAEELLTQMQQSSMLPAMLRASLPRPQRANLAKRAARLHHSRPRDYRTAHQMMHGGPTEGGGAGGGAAAAGRSAGRRKAQRRPLGKLEKMDLIVRQQVRAAMLAQQRQQQQELQQQLLCCGAPEAGPDGARLALPAPAPGPASSSSGQVASGSSSGSSAPARLGSAATPIPNATASSATPRRPPGSGTPDDQRQQHQPQHREAIQSALAVRPGPAGAAGVAPCMLQSPAAPSPLAVLPPPFRPLPPDLRARMQGAPKPSAAATAPPARAAAAGPPPPPPPTLLLSSEPAAQASPPAAASSDVGLEAAGSDAAEAGASGLEERDAADASGTGPSRDGVQGSGGSSLALTATADCRGNGSDEITVSVPRVARLAKGVRKAGSQAEGGGIATQGP